MTYTEHTRDIQIDFLKLKIELLKRNISQRGLMRNGISSLHLTQMREGRPISRYTLDKLIQIIECNEKDIIKND